MITEKLVMRYLTFPGPCTCRSQTRCTVHRAPFS